MDFGRIDSYSSVNYAFPPERNLDLGFLAGGKLSAGLRVRIGLTAFSEKDWVGNFYPSTTKTNQMLQAYASNCGTIEFNPTYYGIPTDLQIQKWRAQVDPSFKFCPKFPSTLSKDPLNTLGSFEWEEWIHCLEAFGQNAGPCFMQLPLNYGPENENKLLQFFQSWDNSKSLTLELRHPGWFESSRLEKLAQFLFDIGIGLVITDVAGRKDVCHMLCTASYCIVRFVGNQHSSDLTRLIAWAEKLHLWESNGLKDIYFFVHQPSPESSFKSAHWFGQYLNKNLKMNVSFPKYAMPNEQQMSLFI
ncbi:MAG: DUF72 domain-containing protein [Saprospiraceae bacterium]